MRRHTKILLPVLIILVSVFTVGCANTTISTNRVLKTPIEISMPDEEGVYIEKVGDGSMILARLNTDYGFSEYLKRGSSSKEDHIEYLKASGIDFYDKALELRSPFCTAYSAEYGSGNFIMGRSNDLFPDDTVIMLYTKPDDGYSSISMTDGVYFGYENKDTLDIGRNAQNCGSSLTGLK